MYYKAAVLNNFGQLDIEEVVHKPLERGQIVVELYYSGVCHSQLMEVKGNRGEDKYIPHMMGHEGTGIVKEVGEGVSKVFAGDAVVLGWLKGEGINAELPRYVTSSNRIINAGGVTTFNEFSVVSENRVVKLPEGVPFDIGVLFGCAIPTGAGIIMNEIKPRDGSTLAVFGLGGIGLSALMATKLYGCSRVIAIDIEENKLQLAREFGVTHTINVKTQNVLEEIYTLTGGLGLDYSIEATGISQMIETAFRCVKKNGGLCVFASHPKDGDKICLDPHDLISGKQIKGSWGGASRPDIDIPKFAQLYLDGKLPLEKLLGKRYGLDQINQALEDLENRKTTRPIIVLNDK